MNQPTHAWLAVEAYRKILLLSKTAEGRKRKLDGLERLLGASLKDVVVAAWLPDSLIKDMTYGHVFKNSRYKGGQTARFTLGRKDLAGHLPSDARVPKAAFSLVPDSWWSEPYRVKENGGHLPARVSSLCQTARDMFKMGDSAVVELTGVKPKGSETVADEMLSSPQHVATVLWMASHYIADAHMPFHSDNRALASTAKQTTHGAVEDLWGKQVSKVFHDEEIASGDRDAILGARPPAGSRFVGIDFGTGIGPLRNSGDPWKEGVYICRASFAASFALVPPEVAGVDDRKAKVGLKDILAPGFCGEERFWSLSGAIMADAANAIARFWVDAWADFVGGK